MYIYIQIMYIVYLCIYTLFKILSLLQWIDTTWIVIEGFSISLISLNDAAAQIADFILPAMMMNDNDVFRRVAQSPTGHRFGRIFGGSHAHMFTSMYRTGRRRKFQR